MTQAQFKILDKYAKRYEIFQKAKTLSLEHNEKQELADLRMELRRSATNIACSVCVIDMLEDLFRNEYMPYKIAQDNLDKHLEEVKHEPKHQKRKRK